MKTVTAGAYDAPRKTAALYAADGVLWGTEVHAPDDPLWGAVSEEVRDTPEQIYAYYVSALVLFFDQVQIERRRQCCCRPGCC